MSSAAAKAKKKEALKGPEDASGALSAGSALTEALAGVEVALEELESKLAAARSPPVQHAIKKQIAVKKAEKKRIEKKMAEAT